jgi:glycerate kinase
MRVICAPDSFKESLSAEAAARAMASGIAAVAPDVEVDCCPIGDGGEGTAAALVTAAGGQWFKETVMGPLGEPVCADWALVAQDQLAVLEMAAAAGLALVPAELRDPEKTTSYGVGQLIKAACASGAKRLIVCVGGSATNDGGCGMAQALGIRFLSATGAVIDQPITGGMLATIARIDSRQRCRELDDMTIIVASDVTNPLTGPLGAARVFGPQKGASPAQTDRLDAGLEHLGRLIRDDLGMNVANLPGAGAAGGLAAGLLAFAAAQMASGIELVLEAVDFSQRVAVADLCLTGEGRLDSQSLAGKACIGVARAAASYGVPTVALVGALGPGTAASLGNGLIEAVVIGPDLAPAESMRRAAELIAAAAGRTVLAYRP